jgi:hypothetical protein
LTTYRQTVYFSYLFFQLYSHKDLYADGGSDVQKSVKYAKHSKSKDDVTAPSASRSSQADLEANNTEEKKVKEEEDIEIPQLSVVAAVSTLIIVTVVRAVSCLPPVPSTVFISVPVRRGHCGMARGFYRWTHEFWTYQQRVCWDYFAAYRW